MSIPSKPSERIKEIADQLLEKTKKETEYDKLSNIEKGLAFSVILNQSIINFLDEVME